MRASVISTFALAVALAPAAGFAQTPPPPAQPPAGQTPAAQQPAAPAAPKLNFSTPAGMLLVQVKSDQGAVFEEMMNKIKAGLAKSDKPDLQKEATGLKVYKAAEAMGGNTLYVIVADPAVPDGEYSFLDALQKTMTDAEQRDPATADLYKKYLATYAPDGKALGLNKLNLTPVGGGL
jgi:hypothetical protein